MNTDYFEINDVLEMQKADILAEYYAMEALLKKAEELEAIDSANEFAELIELANLTAEMNPISESAEEIREELDLALMQLA